jgi:hypothetical protein
MAKAGAGPATSLMLMPADVTSLKVTPPSVDVCGT